MDVVETRLAAVIGLGIAVCWLPPSEARCFIMGRHKRPITTRHGPMKSHRERSQPWQFRFSSVARQKICPKKVSFKTWGLKSLGQVLPTGR